MFLDSFLPNNGSTRWIGESFSPYKRPALQRAYKEKLSAHVLDLAHRQIDGGAEMLNVSAFMEGGDESELFSWLIPLLQDSVQVPLLIDTWNFQVQVSAAKISRRPVILNSVAYRKNTEIVLDAVRRYNCGLVLMPLLDGKVLKTWKERFMGLEPLLMLAEAAGIPQSRLLVDCIVLPQIKGNHHLEESVRFVEECNKKGLATIAGISNYSAGLMTDPLDKNAQEKSRFSAQLWKVKKEAMFTTDRARLNYHCRSVLSIAGLSWGIVNPFELSSD